MLYPIFGVVLPSPNVTVFNDDGALSPRSMRHELIDV